MPVDERAPDGSTDGNEAASENGERGVDGRPEDGPTDEAVVRAGATAAEGVVFSRYKQSAVEDLDVTIRFEEDVLEIDIYLNAPADPDPETVADEAVRAAEAAVDELVVDATNS